MCPGHNRWPWQCAISMLNVVKSEPLSLNPLPIINFLIPTQGQHYYSLLLNKVLDILCTTSYFPQTHVIKFWCFFLHISVISCNLDPIFKPHNDGFNLIYCKEQWIDIKRFGRPKLRFCLYHEIDKPLRFTKLSFLVCRMRGCKAICLVLLGKQCCDSRTVSSSHPRLHIWHRGLCKSWMLAILLPEVLSSVAFRGGGLLTPKAPLLFCSSRIFHPWQHLSLHSTYFL